MKPRYVLLLGLALFFSDAALADTTPATNGAAATAPSLPPGLAVMRDWLAEFDLGDYARCWKESGKLMQSAVPLPKWVDDDKRQEQAFGRCVNRQITGAQRHNRFRLPDGSAITGEFLEADFSTDFEKQKGVTERISSMKEADGVWRVFAYDARPSHP